MRCPFCKGEVDLIEGVEDLAAGDRDETGMGHQPFGRVQCPHPRCARDVVLAVVPLEDAALLDGLAARDAAWRAGHSQPSYLVTAFVVCGLAVCGVMAAASALPDALLLPIAAISLIGMAVAPFALDRVLGTRRWLKSLPQRDVKLRARGEGYRS
jgi:hypothetical protein